MHSVRAGLCLLCTHALLGYRCTSAVIGSSPRVRLFPSLRLGTSSSGSYSSSPRSGGATSILSGQSTPVHMDSDPTAPEPHLLPHRLLTFRL